MSDKKRKPQKAGLKPAARPKRAKKGGNSGSSRGASANSPTLRKRPAGSPPGSKKTATAAAALPDAGRGREITGRRPIEEALLAGEGLIASVVESSADAIFVKDLQGRYVMMNRAGSALFGRKAEEILGKDDTALFSPAEAATIIAQDRELIKSASSIMYEHQLTFADGQKIMQVRKGPVFDRRRRVIGVYGISRDITMSRQVEGGLKQSLSLLQATLQSTADGILVVSEDGSITDFNEQFAALWGIPRTLLDLHDDRKALDFVLDQLKHPELFIAKVKELYSSPDATSFDVLEFRDGRVFERYSQPQRIDGRPVGRVWSFRDITERRKVEDALRESENRYRLMVETTNEGIWSLDSERRTTFVNEALLNMLGYTRGEMLGALPDDFIFAEDMEDHHRHMELRGEGKDGLYERRLRRRDGSVFWGLVSGTSLFDADGSVAGSFAMVTDITERKIAEEALQESERRYRKTFENAQDVFYQGDRQGRVVDISPSIKRYSGFEREEIIGRPILDFYYYAEDRAKLLDAMQATGEVGDFEVRLKTKDGSLLYTSVNAHFVRDASGTVAGIEGSLRDITERKGMEERLRKSEENLKRAEKIAGLGNWEWNILTDELLWSDEVFRIYGLDPLKEKPSYDVVVGTLAPECRERFVRAVEDAVKNAAPFDGEYRMIGLDGRERFTHTTGEVSRDKEGRPVSMFGVVRDITEQISSEDALRRSEALYHDLVETAQDLIWQCDAEGRYTYLNPAWEAVFGYGLEEMLGRPFTDFQSPETGRRDRETFGRLLSNGVVTGYETVHRAKDGSDVHLVFNAKYVRDAQGGVIGTRGTAYDITGRKRAEKAVRDSEEKFRSVYENIGIGIALIGKDMEILSINPQMRKWFPNIDSGEQAICYRSFNTPPRDGVCSYCPTVQTLKDGQVHSAVTDTPTQSGVRHYRIVSSPLLGADGSVSAAIEMVEDITERRQAEDELLLSRQWLSLHVQQTPLAVIEFDLEGRLRGWNPAATEMFGFTSREAIGQHWHLMVPKDVWGSLDGVWEGLVSQRGGSRSTNRNITKDGRIIDCEWFNTPLVDPEGRTIGVASLVMDVTERKLAEEKVLQSEAKYRNLFESSTDGIFILDLEGNFIDANRTAYARLGYTREELLALHISKLDHPDFSPRIPERMAQIRRDGVAVFETAHFRKDGTVMPVEINARLIQYEGGPVYFSLVRDITARKEAEERLRQSEQFIRSILDTVDEGFIVVDRDYRILTANKAYCGQVRMPCDEVIGRPCHEISHRSSRPCYEEGEECAVRQVFETGEPHTVLHRHADHEGNVLYVETKGFPIKDASGNVMSVIETINNITEKYLLQEERLKTQKLESIGTLAGGIAHDFNNLLQGVFGYISMARMSLGSPERVKTMLQQAEEALHLSVNLTTQLLTFSKGGKPVKKLIRLQPVVENSVRFALSGSHSDYQLEIADDLWPVEADEGQLGQVIQNMALNSNEAMAGRGTVKVRAHNADIPRGANTALPAGGRYVRIEILDSGIGIPPQNAGKIFDPYFTTKQRGSGLGLATSYSIIKNHGGLIEVASEVNKGSTFTIFLPAAEGAEVPVAVGNPAMAAERKGRILVMDDEDMVRDVAREMIAALGHEVEAAADGKEAVDLFRRAREDGRPFDVLILDLTVRGGMGGEEAINRIREFDPDVAAVVSSGYADNPVVADFRTYGFSAFLNKPYQIDALRDCLRELLREP